MKQTKRYVLAVMLGLFSLVAQAANEITITNGPTAERIGMTAMSRIYMVGTYEATGCQGAGKSVVVLCKVFSGFYGWTKNILPSMAGSPGNPILPANGWVCGYDSPFATGFTGDQWGTPVYPWAELWCLDNSVTPAVWTQLDSDNGDSLVIPLITL